LKANKILELFPLRLFFYSGYNEVYQQSSATGFIEKHYYKMDKNNRLLIYPEDSPDYEKNPVLVGNIHVYSSDQNNRIFMWREGEAFFQPLFNKKNLNQTILKSSEGRRLINFGQRLNELNNPIEKFQSQESAIMRYLQISTIASILTLIAVYFILKEMGVVLIEGVL